MKNESTSKTTKTAAKKSPNKKTLDPFETKPKDLNKNARSMNLDGSRSLISKVFLGIVLFCLTFFFARTAFWEYKYYNEQEGRARATAETVEDATATEVDETEVTTEQRREHNVEPTAPRYLSIEKLGIINARVYSMGINTSGELDTPYNIFDVGWYSQSSKPGSGGVLVMDGHNGGPNVEGVFKHINQLYAGDLITIERGDGGN